MYISIHLQCSNVPSQRSSEDHGITAFLTVHRQISCWNIFCGSKLPRNYGFQCSSKIRDMNCNAVSAKKSWISMRYQWRSSNNDEGTMNCDAHIMFRSIGDLVWVRFHQSLQSSPHCLPTVGRRTGLCGDHNDSNRSLQALATTSRLSLSSSLIRVRTADRMLAFCDKKMRRKGILHFLKTTT